MRYDHDEYGKRILKEIFGKRYKVSSKLCTKRYGKGGTATIDGVIGRQIAVEIESRTPKQVRGAVLDLIMNPLKKKVLLLLPVHMSNIEATAKQCEFLLSRFVKPKRFCVIRLKGTGKRQRLKKDIELVITKLKKFS